MLRKFAIVLGLVLQGNLCAFPETPVIFIHGIKGARLEDPQGKAGWFTSLQALGLSTPDLALPTRWENETQPKDRFCAANILDYITLIPYVFREPIYGPWLEQAKKASGRLFHPFAYDWRRDNLENLEQFERFIDEVLVTHGGHPVQVVAHSMGGLLTLAALNHRPNLFQSVVFAGVPFQGGIGFLPDLHVGVANGLNRRILDWSVLGTFPSTYTLFAGKTDSLKDSQGKTIPADLFSVADWEHLQLGYFGKNRNAPPGWKNFLKKNLEHAAIFRGKLIPPAGQRFPKIAVIASAAFPTLATAIQNGPKSKVGWDFDSAPKVPGDGRVQEKNALPTGLSFTRWASKKDHAELLNDPEIMQQIESLRND